jgi:uncharacterized membrane protein YkgB
MTLFKEQNGVYSWRRILTCIAALIFAFSTIGFLFGLPELPGSYQAIIAGVFGFYFVKDLARNVKIKTE